MRLGSRVALFTPADVIHFAFARVYASASSA
jgi:hypothetical protein